MGSNINQSPEKVAWVGSRVLKAPVLQRGPLPSVFVTPSQAKLPSRGFFIGSSSRQAAIWQACMGSIHDRYSLSTTRLDGTRRSSGAGLATGIGSQ